VLSLPKPPPVSAEFQTTMEPSQPGVQPQQQPWKLFRSSDGKTSLDQGSHSLITDPSAGQVIHLDHVKKEARVFPLPAAPSINAPQPGAPQAPQPPKMPLDVKGLGKRFIGGHEVEGKSYTFSPPQQPQSPQSPGAPQLQPPHVIEVWTSPKLQLPLASRVTGGIGKQTTICKQAAPGEPPASAFQIPAGYKLIKPPDPHAPSTGS
jgi:hypothetical protein